jgi:hypothetical protein
VRFIKSIANPVISQSRSDYLEQAGRISLHGKREREKDEKTHLLKRKGQVLRYSTIGKVYIIYSTKFVLYLLHLV